MRKTEQNHEAEPVRSAVEREEDLLEHIYRKWRKDKIVTIRDYAREQGVIGQEIPGDVADAKNKYKVVLRKNCCWVKIII